MSQLTWSDTKSPKRSRVKMQSNLMANSLHHSSCSRALSSGESPSISWYQQSCHCTSRTEDLPCIPPHEPCTFKISRSAIAAPCRDSQAGENSSTSKILTRPSHTQQPGSTSNALVCCAAFGETAPPLDGSMTTLSGVPPFVVLVPWGLAPRGVRGGVSSASTRRTL